MAALVGPPNLRCPLVSIEVFTPVNAIVGFIDLILTEDVGNDGWIDTLHQVAGYVHDLLVYCPNLTIAARVRLFEIASAGTQFAPAVSLNARRELWERCLAAHKGLRALSDADRLLFYRREFVRMDQIARGTAQPGP